MSRYTLSGPALQDIATILAESAARFGDAASATALVELAADPARPGSRVAPELANGARIYHLRGSKRRARTGAGAVGAPRHFVLYRVLEPDLIGVVRVLHDSIDLPAHATDDFGGG